MDKVKYNVETNRKAKNGEVYKQEFTKIVLRGKNLLKHGYEVLQEALVLKAEKDIPMYVVYDTYTITGVTILKDQCEGCIMDWGGQRGHMQCPEGCLHDKEDCDECTSPPT